jgi:hypoxanthine phosphoribosyltransferase
MRILFPRDEINKKVSEIAEKISEDYNGKSILLLCVLKGSFIFFADLVRYLSKYDLNVEIEFIRVKSYCGTSSTGKLEFMEQIPEIKGKNVLIVEDIYDTGLTLYKIFETLSKQSPLTLSIASFLIKKQNRKFIVPIRYYGFDIDNFFVVGYGLDYNEKYRELPYIAVIDNDWE